MKSHLPILAAFLLICRLAQATEIPAGPVSGIWSAAGNPYNVNGDIYIDYGASLSIDPGVHIFFRPYASLTINGLLLALGTQADSILLSIADTSMHWHGLRFVHAQDSSRLTYCVIEHSYADPAISIYKGGGIFCANSSPIIEHCSIRHNQALMAGGGIALTQSSNARISHCRIIENICGGDGGGIYSQNSNPLIERSQISGNWALAAGGIHCYEADPEIRYCLISYNQSQTDAGGIGTSLAHPIITNCTVANNETAFLGAGIMVILSQVVLRNTIVAGNLGFCGIYNYLPGGRIDVSYGDFYNNEGGNIGGVALPDSFEVIVTVNVNGDSCDPFYNIFEDPLFYAVSGDSAFHLSSQSPCIDAGDPLSPLDPDGTVGDIGCFYFDQDSLAPAAVILTPYGTPIIIPAAGGSFHYNIAAHNLTAAPLSCDVWCNITLPNGSLFGPVLGPITITLPAGSSLERDRTQNLPARAPSGSYSFNAYIGAYPDSVWGSDSFPFTKSGAGDWGLGSGDWSNIGESFEVGARRAAPAISNSSFILHNSPNPFNSSTVIRFDLPEAGFGDLEVFDISGRLVGEWHALCLAGQNQISFDGSNQPTGIYLYQLKIGEYSAAGKMLLLK
jgi:hypothetical protein